MSKLFSNCNTEKELVEQWTRTLKRINSLDELGYINKCYKERIVEILNKGEKHAD